MPFQRLKLLKSSLKVSVAVADRLFGSIATFGSPSMAFAYQESFSGVLTGPLELYGFASRLRGCSGRRRAHVRQGRRSEIGNIQ